VRKKAFLGLLLFLWNAGLGFSGQVEVSFLAGFSTNLRFGRLVPLSNTADVPDVKILLQPESPEWSLRFGYGLGRHFGLEAAASRTEAGIVHDVGIGLAGIPLGKTKVADASAWSFGGSLLFDFGWNRASPYLVLGGGATTLKVKDAGTKSRPYLEFGAGLKTRLSRRFRLVLDIRPQVTFFRFFEDFRFAYILIYRLESRNVQTSLKARLGLAFLL